MPPRVAVSPLSRCGRVAVRWSPGSGSEASFPHTTAIGRRHLPSTGSLRARFPRFSGTTRRSDSLPRVPTASLPRPPVPCRAACRSLPRRGSALPVASLGFDHRAPSPVLSGLDMAGSLRSLATPHADIPRSPRTPAARNATYRSAPRRGLPPLVRCRRPATRDFGAQSRGLDLRPSGSARTDDVDRRSPRTRKG